MSNPRARLDERVECLAELVRENTYGPIEVILKGAVPYNFRRLRERQELYVTAKSVPSALAVVNPGTTATRKLYGLLVRFGFRMEVHSNITKQSPDGTSGDSGSDSDEDEPVKDADITDADIFEAETVSTDPASVTETLEVPKHSRVSINPDNFFEIFSMKHWEQYAKPQTKPRVLYWPGDVLRIQDSMSPTYFNFKKYGRDVPRRKISFVDIALWM